MALFTDRADAGRRLAEKLRAYANRSDVIVFGIPRGGLVVAFEVAVALGAPLDVFAARKLGVPGQEELAFGAVASGGVRVLDREVIDAIEISTHEIDQITQRERAELERRELAYRRSRPPLGVAGKTVILIDDGIATGASTRAAIDALRQLNPARIVVAVPVAPLSTCRKLSAAVDDLVCVYMPEHFHAIGQFYDDFSQVADKEVSTLIERSAQLKVNPALKENAPNGGNGVTE